MLGFGEATTLFVKKIFGLRFFFECKVGELNFARSEIDVISRTAGLAFR